MQRFVVTLLVRGFYRFADKVISPSQGARHDVQTFARLSAEQTVAIANPIALKHIQHEMKETVDHPWLQAERSLKTLVTAGRLKAEKSHDVLLHAFARLYHSDASLRLIILGEGEKKEELGALAQQLGIDNAVDFVGFKANPYAYFYHADLFVLSSQAESFANVVVEALTCGCPVVATNCPYGPAEILGGIEGALAQVNDPASLAEKINQMLQTPTPKPVLLAKAAQFGVEVAAEAYLREAGLI